MNWDMALALMKAGYRVRLDDWGNTHYHYLWVDDRIYSIYGPDEELELVTFIPIHEKNAENWELFGDDEIITDDSYNDDLHNEITIEVVKYSSFDWAVEQMKEGKKCTHNESSSSVLYYYIIGKKLFYATKRNSNIPLGDYVNSKWWKRKDVMWRVFEDV
jgi:hypothetical protein